MRIWIATPSSAALVAAICWLGPLPCGCKCSPSADPATQQRSAEPAVSAAPSPEQASASQCLPLPGWGLTLDADSAQMKPGELAEDEEDPALLPFGVDVGGAVDTASGFALGGLRGAGQAFVALIGEQESRRIDLGELHGDVEPPVVAADAGKVLVALRSSDAAGFTIKLGQLGAAGVDWGHELSHLGSGVSSLDLALSGPGGALVFQAEGKGGSRLLLATFAIDDLRAAFEAKPLEVKDVESPRLVARPGGYWLAWVRSLPESKKAPAPRADAGPPEDPEERDLLELGLRGIEVAKLDQHGNVEGAPRRVGAARRQVVLFDVAPLASGGLLVAARSDSAAPGAEGGALVLSEIAPDGSVREEQLEDDEIGAGAPTLAVDALAKEREPWLLVSSPSDAIRLGPARGAKTVLMSDPLLARVEVIAVRAGRFLTARARGRGVELAVVVCRLSPQVQPENK